MNTTCLELGRWYFFVLCGASGKFVHRQAVRDGKIITANGTASLEFAKEVMLALQAASVEAITTWYEFYKLGSYTVPRT